MTMGKFLFDYRLLIMTRHSIATSRGHATQKQTRMLLLLDVRPLHDKMSRGRPGSIEVRICFYRRYLEKNIITIRINNSVL